MNVEDGARGVKELAKETEWEREGQTLKLVYILEGFLSETCQVLRIPDFRDCICISTYYYS